MGGERGISGGSLGVKADVKGVLVHEALTDLNNCYTLCTMCMKAFIDQIMGLSYEEMMDLNEEKLEKMGVTKVSHLDNANIKISSENIS